MMKSLWKREYDDWRVFAELSNRPDLTAKHDACFQKGYTAATKISVHWLESQGHEDLANKLQKLLT